MKNMQKPTHPSKTDILTFVEKVLTSADENQHLHLLYTLPLLNVNIINTWLTCYKQIWLCRTKSEKLLTTSLMASGSTLKTKYSTIDLTLGEKHFYKRKASLINFLERGVSLRLLNITPTDRENIHKVMHDNEEDSNIINSLFLAPNKNITRASSIIFDRDKIILDLVYHLLDLIW